MTKLTAAQERYLAEIREAGVKTYNGRARKPIEALEAAGLVTSEFTLVPQMNMRFTEQFTVRPVVSDAREVKLPVRSTSISNGRAPGGRYGL